MRIDLPDAVDVLVVGAGHAGLAMSRLLTHEGREHVLVGRRDRLGGGPGLDGPYLVETMGRQARRRPREWSLA
jgi:cation diffusion facilitator CzcD-associated flavoprotein CzcO